MRKFSIQDLKKRLSLVIAKAASGEVLITKYNKPFIVIKPADELHVHTGKNFGKANLRSVLKNCDIVFALKADKTVYESPSDVGPDHLSGDI
ncbi:MAG: type II toxin-antitoxin system Phd/YefM family antitoxin [Planctomycetota bacterium]